MGFKQKASRRFDKVKVWNRRAKIIFFLVVITLFFSIPPIWLTPQKAQAASSITHINSQTAAQSASSGFVVVNKPTSMIPGDVMVAVASVAAVTTTISGPAGWNSITNSALGTVNGTIESFWKVATESEASTYTFDQAPGTDSRMSVGVSAFRGVDNTNPIDATSTASTGTNTSLPQTSITTNTNNAVIIGAYGGNTGNGVTTLSYTPPGTPAGITERADIRTTNASSSNTGVEITEYTKATAGTHSPTNGTASVNINYGTHQFALKVAPPPGLNQSAYRFLSNLDAQNPEYIVHNITAGAGNDDTIRGLASDSANGFMYIGGYTVTPSWLVQKRRLSDGSLDTGFATSGTYNPGSGTAPGNVGGIAIDPAGNAIFVAGNNGGGGAWTIRKMRMSDGALCTAGNCGVQFGTNGVLTPGVTGSLNSLDIDTVNGYIYAAGYDTGSGNTARIGKYSTSTGAADATFTTNIETPTACTSISGTACYNVSSGDDRLRTVSVDSQNGYVYGGGWSTSGTTQWTMQKRRLSDGLLCTAARCGTQFGTAGIYTYNSAGADQILTFQVDTPGNAIYVGGVENNGGSNRWRLEKLSASAGTRITAFGNLAGDPCATAGVVCYNSAGDDQLLDLDLDDAGGFIYTTGQDDPSDMHWRIEKRFRDTGALCTTANTCDTTFGGTDGVCTTGGVVCIDPSANDDQPAWIAVDLPRNLLYTSGGDRSPGATDQAWRIQKIDLDYGGLWLNTPQDTAALASTNITFRLRLLLHVTVDQILIGDQTYKLQYATKVGTCDTSFVGETYADVATSGTEVIYHNNSSIADASVTIGVTGDPAHSGHTTILESIEESNSFSPIANAGSGQDGMWDFVLKDNNAFGVYCFRVTYNDGTPTLLTSTGGSYTQIPELSFCRNTPNTDALLRSGTYFCGGVKKSFYWAKE